MYCTNCGHRMEETAQFCTSCGQKKTAKTAFRTDDSYQENRPPFHQPNIQSNFPYPQQQPKKSNPARIGIIISSVVAGLLVIIGICNYLLHATTNSTMSAFGNKVTVGAVFDNHSTNLDVSDQEDLQAGQKVYARLETASRFRTSTIKFIIQEKNGTAWHNDGSKNISVSPNDSILVEYFVPDHANTYRILFVNGSDVMGEVTVDVPDGQNDGQGGDPNNDPNNGPDDNSNTPPTGGDNL